MRLKPLLLALCGGCAAMVLVAHANWEASESSARAAERHLQSVIVDGKRILELRSIRTSIAAGKKPDADVITRVHEALLQAGIPTSILRDVGQASDLAMPGESEQRRLQSVRFTLGSIQLSQLGEFLKAWQAAEGTWVVTRIEFSTSAQPSEVAAVYNATLTISTMYIVQDERP